MSFTTLAQSAQHDHFLHNMGVIDALRDVGTGTPATTHLAADLNLDVPATAYLRSPDGKTLIGKWALAFKASLTALDEFREAELRSRRRRAPSESDVEKVASASQDILDAFKERIQQKSAP